MRHLDNMAKIILLTGSMVGYAYLMEFFIAWYSREPLRAVRLQEPRHGPYWWAYWAMMFLQRGAPQLFWFKKVRRTNLGS
jgi:hypothetical protein